MTSIWKANAAISAMWLCVSLFLIVGRPISLTDFFLGLSFLHLATATIGCVGAAGITLVVAYQARTEQLSIREKGFIALAGVGMVALACAVWFQLPLLSGTVVLAVICLGIVGATVWIEIDDDVRYPLWVNVVTTLPLFIGPVIGGGLLLFYRRRNQAKIKAA